MNINAVCLKPFEMMSGLVTPKSIGLTEIADITSMIKLTKKLFAVCDIIYLGGDDICSRPRVCKNTGNSA